MDVIILLTNRDHFTDLWASIATISLITVGNVKQIVTISLIYGPASRPFH